MLQIQVLQQTQTIPDRLWQGHPPIYRGWVNIESTPSADSRRLKAPSDTAHYPQGLASCLYKLSSKIHVDFDLANHADERKMALARLSSLSDSDVVVYDRGYYSDETLYEHNQRQNHTIFRLRTNDRQYVRSTLGWNIRHWRCV